MDLKESLLKIWVYHLSKYLIQYLLGCSSDCIFVPQTLVYATHVST